VAISISSLTRGGELKPTRIAIYSGHGWGKTSLAAGAPSPVILQTEDGLGLLQTPTFGLLRTYDEVMAAIGELVNEEHDFQTVIVDTVDWLEPIVWQETCRQNGWANVEAAGYGKGFLAAVDTWRVVLDGLNALRDERGMSVILLAHAEVKRYEAPDTDPYDRYQIKLHNRASALLQEHVDAVLFGNYRVSLVRTDPKDKNSKQRGVGGGARVLYTTERPSHLAKNRWRMPDQISLPDDPDQTWSALAEHIPYYNQHQKDAA
jgi:hypothetical protein